ncbi:antitoxin component YwqK of YwqJK toxin-antitoxin module [Lacinutrix venerupis]|uniref:toxin-antitoxin system YwqK family antitoxin n=1 Tax=Lacinutrix venerupis TaxID=1486034 RepID=UPI000EAEC645|nr:toxin-antitoxin system YwqK family antitoxin [Lacinutrix venerupis]RLJ62522.1 antitoxin component YwqK of YwqJK toxin-antitoxin module [Lacinutrix venerupis]
MNRILLLILALVSFTLSAQNINQMDADGNRHGVWKKNFEGTKVLRYEGKFNHGKEVGTFKFYKNIENQPVLTATRTFSETSDLADVKFFSSTKHLISEGKMRGKTFVGKWIYYHNRSKVVMTEEFYDAKGKLEGLKKTYYLSGQLAKQENYNSGIVDGESKWYSESGKLLKVFNYKNGELHGPAKIYDTKGNIEQEGVYQKDRRHGIWKFYKKGTLIKEQDFTRRSKNPYKKK